MGNSVYGIGGSIKLGSICNGQVFGAMQDNLGLNGADSMGIDCKPTIHIDGSN